jgi:hypothetical protein
LIGDA